MFMAMVKQALTKGLLDGTSSVIEEMCENMDVKQLDRLITILKRVRDKKSSTIDVRIK